MAQEHRHAERPHPTPVTYAKVAVTLAALTGVELVVFYIESLRSVFLPVFMLLSAAKFILVAMFYMHLRFDSRLFTGLFVFGLLVASAVVIALMGLFGVIGHGGGERAVASAPAAEEKPGTSAKEETTGASPTVVSPGAAGALDIGTKGDTLEFSKKSITVKAGADVAVRLKNDAKALQHNWVLVKAGTKDAVAAAGATAGPTSDWVPPKDERVIAYTKLVDPGKTGAVQFTAPAAGTYQFVCTFPGHNVTMFGTFEVTR